jgi:diadenylate cyclase
MAEENEIDQRIEILKKFSHGSVLRNAIEKISKSGRGALIVFFNDKRITKAFKGGFKINSELTAEKLAELAKLDGAIVIDYNKKKILFANVLLHPSIKYSSNETGTRHQTAERMAKQFNTIVLAVSEKTRVASVYAGDKKIILNSLNDLYLKLGESLKMLEKHKENFFQLVEKLNVLESLELVSIENLAAIFQKKRIIDDIINNLYVYLTELGTEGEIFGMQVKEVVNAINREMELIIQDYSEFFNFDKIVANLQQMSKEEIIAIQNVIKVFETNKKKEEIVARGYRLLCNIHQLTEDNVRALIENFSNLKNIMNASNEELLKVKGMNERKIKAIRDYLIKLGL